MSLFIVYGNEPWIIERQKGRFKRLSSNEFGYAEFTSVPEAVLFLTAPNLFTDKLYACLEVDGIKDLTTKSFLTFAENIRDRKDQGLFVYVKKVKSDAKGLEKLKAAGALLMEYNKPKEKEKLMDCVNQICKEQNANFTEGAKFKLLEQLDYFNNESVTLITLENYIGQLKYLSSIVDETDIKNNVPDMREGQRFALATLIAKGLVQEALIEAERLKRENDFSGIGLMSLLYREYRIAYLLNSVGCSLREQKVYRSSLSDMDAERIVQGLNIITDLLMDAKTGVYDQSQAFDLCLSRLLAN